MKICLISFDYWNYDKHIVEALKAKGIDATHIDISKFEYKYKNSFEKIANFFLKLLLKKNIKKIKRQEFILDELKHLGKQNQILCIRPDLIEKKTHLKIKGVTNKYITYIYDSCKRFPFDHLLDDIFDEIYSFDLEDVKNYNFKHITNYIYLKKQPIRTTFARDVFMVISPDERLKQLDAIANTLDKINASYKFVVVTHKSKPKALHKNIEFSKSRIDTEDLKAYLNDSKVILDLLRTNHNGLSFRVFEALAYQKKIITTNASIKNYTFYNPNNILVLDSEKPTIDASFFETPYEKLDDAIYNKFTVSQFISTVFNL